MAKEPKPEDDTSTDDKFLQQILASRVREIRRNLKLPQHELATLIGTKQAYIFLVEAAEANVTLKTLGRLAKALKVDPRDLLRHEPLPELDNSKSRELSILVQSSIKDLQSNINYFSKGTQDAAKIGMILQKIHDLLIKVDQNTDKEIAEKTESSFNSDK